MCFSYAESHLWSRAGLDMYQRGLRKSRINVSLLDLTKRVERNRSPFLPAQPNKVNTPSTCDAVSTKPYFQSSRRPRFQNGLIQESSLKIGSSAYFLFLPCCTALGRYFLGTKCRRMLASVCAVSALFELVCNCNLLCNINMPLVISS